MKLLRMFAQDVKPPAEIALVQIETSEEQRAKYFAAVAAVRKAMGERHLVHPANQVKRLKEAA